MSSASAPDRGDSPQWPPAALAARLLPIFRGLTLGSQVASEDEDVVDALRERLDQRADAQDLHYFMAVASQRDTAVPLAVTIVRAMESLGVGVGLDADARLELFHRMFNEARNSRRDAAVVLAVLEHVNRLINGGPAPAHYTVSDLTVLALHPESADELQRSKLDSHLNACPMCRFEFDRLGGHVDRLRALAPAE